MASSTSPLPGVVRGRRPATFPGSPSTPAPAAQAMAQLASRSRPPIARLNAPGTITIAGLTFNCLSGRFELQLRRWLPVAELYRRWWRWQHQSDRHRGMSMDGSEQCFVCHHQLGASGTGNGTVNYSVARNLSPDQRTATLTVAGQISHSDDKRPPRSWAISPPGCGWRAAITR